MRRLSAKIALMSMIALALFSCTERDDALLRDYEAQSESSKATGASFASDSSLAKEGGMIALERVVRTLVDGLGEERRETYEIEYSGSELRTSVVERDYRGDVYRSDAFFNVDGTLSFVRMRDAGGNTRTIHFVYDQNGNPIERIVSQDDVPIEKIEFKYDPANDLKRDLIRYAWDNGRWVHSNGHTLSLYLNAAGVPTAFENISDDGKRAVVFEFSQDGAALDGYSDTMTSNDGATSEVSGFVSLRDGRPVSMTVRSDARPSEDLRISASWKDGAEPLGDRVASESVERCEQRECTEIENRQFKYGYVETEPQLPPPSIVMPFLELGSSLVFIETPSLLVGAEGIGLPSWVDL